MGAEIDIEDSITIVEDRTKSDEWSSYDSLINKLKNQTTYGYVATQVYVNGDYVVTVQNKSDAEEVLESIKYPYSTKADDTEIISLEFLERVTLMDKYSNDHILSNKAEAIDKLTEPVVVEKIHIVEQGDSLWQISFDNDIPIEDLLLMNPDFAEDKYLQLGDEIILVLEKPVLSVMTVEQRKYRDVAYREVQTVENNEEYVTYNKVVQEGSDGESEFVINILKQDGQEYNREFVSETVIVPAVPKIVEIGTLNVPPKKAIGSFIIPTRGYYSDFFGTRGGRHMGLDIAAPAGTPVYASDGGVVTHSGWSNGYGYLIKIDHENGYTTYYGHNSKLYVPVGTRVYQGQLIAGVGTTGNSTGNHCHFEIRVNGIPKNPLKYVN